MNLHRIFALARRIISQFRHDRRTLALMFVVPIVVLSILGYVIREQSTVLTVGVVVNEKESVKTPFGDVAFSDMVLNALKDSDAVQVKTVSADEVENEIRAGRLKGAVIIPQDFTSTMLRDRRANLTLLLEGSNPSESAAIAMSIGRTMSAVMPKLLAPGSAVSANPLGIETLYVYGGAEFDMFDTFAPIYLAFLVFFFVFLLTSVSFLRERAQGTLERLMATPIVQIEVILGYMLGFGLFALLQSLVVLLFTVYVLNVHTVGNLVLVFFVESLLVLGAVNLGIFLSTYARNEFQVIQFIPIVIVPQGLLSGMLWPIESLPEWMRWLAQLMPLTYANRALRDVMLKGFDISQVWPDALALLIFVAITILLGALTVRQEIA